MGAELVQSARDSVPHMIEVYDRAGALAMRLGGYNTYFGTGSDLMSMYDLETQQHRACNLTDIGRAAQLCDALPNINFVMSAAHAKDYDPHHAYILAFRAMLEEHHEASRCYLRERSGSYR